jgi:hypothetical protein
VDEIVVEIDVGPVECLQFAEILSEGEFGGRPHSFEVWVVAALKE